MTTDINSYLAIAYDTTQNVCSMNFLVNKTVSVFNRFNRLDGQSQSRQGIQIPCPCMYSALAARELALGLSEYSYHTHCWLQQRETTDLSCVNQLPRLASGVQAIGD